MDDDKEELMAAINAARIACCEKLYILLKTMLTTFHLYAHEKLIGVNFVSFQIFSLKTFGILGDVVLLLAQNSNV